MTEWILKLFVKDYKNAERPSVRSAIGKTAGGVAIGVNVLLSLLKILAGAFLLGGSVSVIADGVNNLSDAAWAGCDVRAGADRKVCRCGSKRGGSKRTACDIFTDGGSRA